MPRRVALACVLLAALARTAVADSYGILNVGLASPNGTAGATLGVGVAPDLTIEAQAGIGYTGWQLAAMLRGTIAGSWLRRISIAAGPSVSLLPVRGDGGDGVSEVRHMTGLNAELAIDNRIVLDPGGRDVFLRLAAGAFVNLEQNLTGICRDECPAGDGFWWPSPAGIGELSWFPYFQAGLGVRF